jgi:hypothetical protein
MMTCSRLYDPLRLIRRDPTLGHQIMHRRPWTATPSAPVRQCMKVWRVEPTFEARSLGVRRDVDRVLRWRRPASAQSSETGALAADPFRMLKPSRLPKAIG